jgi:hypothetical protein
VVVYYITKSLKHLSDGDRKHFKETVVNVEIISKFKALAVALMMNGLVIGGVAYLFNGQIHDHAPVVSVAALVALNASPGRA